MKAVLSATACFAAIALCAHGSIFETNDLQRANLDAVAGWTGATERGLRLDKDAGEVVILAEFCGIDPSTTIEFPIIGELSDRDYEALFRTFARPGAIGSAIEALGVPRGSNVSYSTMDFWPRGSRVTIDFAPFGATNAEWRPIQSCILDMTARAPMAFTSFVYCGSTDMDAADGLTLGTRFCDTEAPNSVFSTYNEPQTLIDLPAKFGQSEVYERFVLAPDSGLVPFGLYRLRIRPATGVDGKPTPRSLAVSVDVLPPGTGAGASYLLRDGSDCVGTPFGDPRSFAERVKALVADGADVFASIRFDGGLTVSEAARQALFLSKLEGEKGLRIVGPEGNQIFYRGFLPDELWRVRKDRPSQPWEIRFVRADGKAAAITLVKTIEDWTSTDSLDPILSTKEFSVATPAEAAETVAREGDGLPVLLAFAPGDMALSEIMPFLLALKPTHPTAYVFAEPPARP